MMDLIDSTLATIDRIYEPSDRAVRFRELLIMSSLAPAGELPYYVAQVSITLTLLDHLDSCRNLEAMRKNAFQANLAFAVTTGLMSEALGISEGVEN